MRANRYAGTCGCGRTVAAGAGFMVRRSTEKPQLLCNRCATPPGETPASREFAFDQ